MDLVQWLTAQLGDEPDGQADALAAWPGDRTLDGYIPPIGAHVFCYRPSDGSSHCGIVNENRCGLFLARCGGSGVVLTAANWYVHAMPATRTCLHAGG